MSRDIRQRALQKIAVLSATSATASTFDRSDLDRLCKATSSHGRGYEGTNGSAKGRSLARVPMVCGPTWNPTVGTCTYTYNGNAVDHT
jgi:phosphatidylinositol 4-kinase A